MLLLTLPARIPEGYPNRDTRFARGSLGFAEFAASVVGRALVLLLRAPPHRTPSPLPSVVGRAKSAHWGTTTPYALPALSPQSDALPLSPSFGTRR